MASRTKLKKAAATAAVAVPAATSALFLSAEVASAAPAAGTYIVQPGDTLAKIAASHGTSWQTLAATNHLANPNLIFPGQVIVLGSAASADPPPPSHAVRDGDGDFDGDSASAAPSTAAPVEPPESAPVAPAVSVPAKAAAPAPVQTHSAPSVRPESTAPTSHASTSSSSVTPSSSFQACVIQRESGGNAQVVNSSGHYGLYQFSSSTWAAYGGSPSLFGHASAAYQTQIFNNAIAAGGQSNWSPYNGC